MLMACMTRRVFRAAHRATARLRPRARRRNHPPIRQGRAPHRRLEDRRGNLRAWSHGTGSAPLSHTGRPRRAICSGICPTTCRPQLGARRTSSPVHRFRLFPTGRPRASGFVPQAEPEWVPWQTIPPLPSFATVEEAHDIRRISQEWPPSSPPTDRKWEVGVGGEFKFGVGAGGEGVKG